MRDSIYIGLLGLGTVGKGIYRILNENEENIRKRVSRSFGSMPYPEIKKILVRDKKKHQEVPGDLLTDDPDEILNDSEISIVIEVMGGEEPASDLMKRAMANGKHVVTANKLALFRNQGKLEEMAEKSGVYLGYEAAVAGAMPVIRAIRESFLTDEISTLRGIINGSTNFIMTRVSEGLTLKEAIKEAGDLGYLESDPKLDLDGYDAMFKTGILAYLISGKYPDENEIERKGITEISEDMIMEAKRDGRRFRLVAEIMKDDDGSARCSVKPQMTDADDPLYDVSGSLNAVTIKLKYARDLYMEGRGAGSTETATAVLSDVFSCINTYFSGR